MKRLAAVLAAVHVLAMTGAPVAQPTQKLVFALNWFAVGDHAAYWVALDKGYYKSRGLDVELQNSKGSGDSIAKVDTNRADVGLADAVVVIPRVAQGARIKIVGAVFDNTPLNIWTRKDTGITRPKDLEGKILAAPPGDSQRQLFPAFAKVNGVDASKVTWLSIEPAAKFVASQAGLGMVIVNAQTNLNTPVAFAALVWISIVGLVLYGAVGLVARWWAPWAETGS